jgi:hypothetical protein
VIDAGTRADTRLAPPAWVRAEAGGLQVTLTWSEVLGAVGYQVYAADSRGGDYRPLVGSAVPRPPYADTSGRPSVVRWYRVAALPAVDAEVDVAGGLSDPVSTAPLSGASVPVVVAVDASRPVGELPVALSGDGAGSLVDAVAVAGEPGEITVRVWNRTREQPCAPQLAGLARHVRIDLSDLPGGAAWTVRQQQWDASAPDADLTVDADGRLSVEIDLPMPGMALLSFLRR